MSPLVLLAKRITKKAKLEVEFKEGVDLAAKKVEQKELIAKHVQAKDDLMSSGQFRSEEKVKLLAKELEELDSFLGTMKESIQN